MKRKGGYKPFLWVHFEDGKKVALVYPSLVDPDWQTALLAKVRGGLPRHPFGRAGARVTYRGWHRKLRRLRGAPGLCESCGSAQTEWALRPEYSVGSYVEDPEAYMALCRRCHSQLDFGGKPRPTEVRDKISRSKLGHPVSTATREKIRASLLGRSQS